MASDIERLANDLQGDKFKSVRATLMAQAEQIRALGGPEHVNSFKVESRISPEQLVVSERKALKKFFGKEFKVSEIPQEALDALAKAQELAWDRAELHFLPQLTLKQNDKFPGWKVKPEPWYWEIIANGNIKSDAPVLGGHWILVDGSQKPNYQDGAQMYENDPFTQLLTNLRKEGKIKQRNHIPEGSRFDISHDELVERVQPEIAKLLDVNKNQSRLPKKIEFNILGNLYHPEWGQRNTWEWFEDKFEGARRLSGGDSDSGGLSDVGDDWSDSRFDFLGFRPLVVFPSKS